MAEELFKVQLANPERQYVKVYQDFLNCKLLTAEEKLIYIALKSFVTYGRDTDEVYPSMETLCNITSMSRSRATRAIGSLVKKGIIKKTRRGLTKTNLYTIVDVPSMWKAETLEEMKSVSENRIDKTNEELIEELLRRGAITLVKEKELESEPTKAQTQALELNPFDIVNTTTNLEACQVERYSIEDIRQLYDYDCLVADPNISNNDIEVVFNILYDVLNTTKKTIRVDGEDKPSMVVVGKLMKLDYEDIKYSITKFHEQTDKIKKVNAYLLTILYHAKEQSYLELMNTGHYNGDF